jgi:pimeloyl-ACP methyl ester carboxylesterase
MPATTNLRLWLIFSALLIAYNPVQAAPTTSNLEREKYWADQVVDTVMVGEAVWLSNRGHKFLALYAAPEKPATTAVILVHGRGVHPAWGFIDKLYRDLNTAGYNTLSLQMPILGNEAKFSAYGPTFPEAFERIETGIRYLHARVPQLRKIFLIGHSSGGMTVVAYAAKQPDPQLAGVAAVGLSTLTGGPDVMQPAMMLRTIRLPVLDIYGSNDLAEVVNFAAARKQAAETAGNRRYHTVRVAGADHFFSDSYPELLKHLRDWLAPLAGTP